MDRTRPAQGYVAATVGALAGSAAGAAVGVGLMWLMMSEDGGLGDIVYILIPLATTPAGAVVGTWFGLATRGHRHAGATAAMTAAAMLVAVIAPYLFGAQVFSFVPVWPLNLVMLLAGPAVARHIVLATRPAPAGPGSVATAPYGPGSDQNGTP